MAITKVAHVTIETTAALFGPENKYWQGTYVITETATGQLVEKRELTQLHDVESEAHFITLEMAKYYLKQRNEI